MAIDYDQLRSTLIYRADASAEVLMDDLASLQSFDAENEALAAKGGRNGCLGGLLTIAGAAIIFSPLLTIAALKDPAIPLTAGVTTLCLFGVLTSVVFVTRKDFSFLGTFLTLGMFAAIALIVVSIVCQFALGPIFTVVMIALACGYILYYTSNVLHHYHSSQHVAASLTLFASVALLLWYVVQMFMYSSD